MSRACSPEREDLTRLGSSNQSAPSGNIGKQYHRPENSNHSALSNTIGKQHHNPMRADQSANRNIGETVEVGQMSWGSALDSY